MAADATAQCAALGGSAGASGGGGTVSVTSTAGAISTRGLNSIGIDAKSIGGGDVAKVTAQVALGGSAAAAGNGGVVTVGNASSIATRDLPRCRARGKGRTS